ARVTREPGHRDWFAAIARGTTPQETVLGTPLAPLPPATAVAQVEAPGISPTAAPPWPFAAAVAVTNAGTATWPVALPPPRPLPGAIYYVDRHAPRHAAVELLARWRPLDDPTAAVPPAQPVRLPRDVPPGETVRLWAVITRPARPGRYRLA